jgi:division protein CdvB (Snf7/Vps24/ESCRT-III family)
MAGALSTYYAQRLEEEQEQLDAVNDALDALDMDRFQSAAMRINNRSAARCAERIASLREIGDALDTLEALAGFLKARIEYLKPLALEERRRELAAKHREYEASV